MHLPGGLLALVCAVTVPTRGSLCIATGACTPQVDTLCTFMALDGSCQLTGKGR